MPRRKTSQPQSPLPAFEQWLLDQDRAPLTVKNYGSDLRLFATWFEQTNGEALAPELLTPTDMRDYRAHLLRQQAAATTINRKLTALGMFAKWALATGRITFNPTENVKMVAQQPLAPKWLDRRQQNALVRQAQKEYAGAKTPIKQLEALRNWRMVEVLLNTGLRVGELCTLQKSQVTLKEHSGQLQVQGKGTKQRTVPLNGVALKALKEWLKVRPNADGHSTSPLFTHSDGTALKPRGVQHCIQELGRLAQLEVTPHTLRHTFAKNLIDAGVTPEKVAALLGQASLDTTRRYILPSALDLEKAVGLVGE